MILSLASARAITRVPTKALFVFVMQPARVEVACILTDSEQVAGSLTLVDSKLAGCVLDALPVLQESAGSSWRRKARCYLLSTLAPARCGSVSSHTITSPSPNPALSLPANSVEEHE